MVENAGKWDRTALNVAAPSSTMEDTVSVSKQYILYVYEAKNT